MFPRLTKPLLAATLLLAGLSPVVGQMDLDLINKPKTVAEHWRLVKFEISQGKYDLAADFLKGLLALNPTDKDLLAIEEREGIAAFLDLRNVQKWSDNAKTQAEARQNVETLIAKTTDALKRFRSDPDRIAKFIKNLSATPEERDYAIVELRKSGTAIMPAFMAALIGADLDERVQLLTVLPLLDPDTVPAVLATFDVPNPVLRVDLMGALARRPDILKLLNRTETDPRPTLWYLSAKADMVGERAREMLLALTKLPPSRLPTAVPELLAAADAVYQHKTSFSAGTDAPPVWKWDGKKLVSAKVSVTQAEEHYGLRFARWALELAPGDEAAQVMFLSIATEKALERGGLEKKLSVAAPAVYELLSLAPASVLYTMADRALTEGHPTVALGAIQVIGDRAESKGVPPRAAARSTDAHKATPDPLVRAVNGKDRRVALAAADALTRVPGTPTHQVSARVVEVYRSILANPADETGAGELKPKALIGDPDANRAEILGGVLRSAGFDTVIVRTGRDALRRLNQAADVDVIWLDHELAYPELPYTLAQVRADVTYGGLPVLVTVSDDVTRSILPEMSVRIERLTRNLPAIKVLANSPIRITLGFDGLKVSQAQLDDFYRELRTEKPTVRVSTEATLVIHIVLDRSKEAVPELKARIAELAVDLPDVRVDQESATRTTLTMDGTRPMPEALDLRLARLERDFKSVLVQRELPTRIHLTSTLSGRVPLDVEARLGRLAEQYRRVAVVPRPITADDVREFVGAFAADPSARPLSAAERKDFQRRAIEGLRRLAVGEVPGYDVRPAAKEIRSAMQSDDLAPAAIDAAARLPGKEPQQDLADVVLNVARPAPIRTKAAAALLLHMQVHSSAPLLDAQVQNLLKLYDTEASAEVKAAVAPVLGALPRERVLRNLPDEAARLNYLNRLRNYEPPLGAATAPPPVKEGR